ncbi:hypothetical protein [Lacisediminimonas profundi]|uniref:hypothetical protein n=1 Tax=Lacisediminimonas profundi TaxID=2603856 RepID=UPI00124BAF7A|nr:hypothetical protein [Lacisediminimonas profundi]
MEKHLFSQYADSIRSLDIDRITNARQIPDSFLLDRDAGLSSYYIPFDFVNKTAKIVIVGITPGFTQWINAMREAKKQLHAGANLEQALIAAKRTGAFSGAMRPNLVGLLDHIGLQKWLGIPTCDQLFSSRSDLVQTTSALRHPIFMDGENYNGTPNMTKNGFLRKQLLDHFGEEVRALGNAVYLPLGPKVLEALLWLAKEGLIDESKILAGLPHPSGANAERIAYFLGRKEAGLLSAKTNAQQLDETRSSLVSQVAQLV